MYVLTLPATLPDACQRHRETPRETQLVEWKERKGLGICIASIAPCQTCRHQSLSRSVAASLSIHPSASGRAHTSQVSHGMLLLLVTSLQQIAECTTYMLKRWAKEEKTKTKKKQGKKKNRYKVQNIMMRASARHHRGHSHDRMR